MALFFLTFFLTGVNHGRILFYSLFFLLRHLLFVLVLQIIQILEMTRGQNSFVFLVVGCFQIQQILTQLEFLIVEIGELFVIQLCNGLLVCTGSAQLDALLLQILAVVVHRLHFLVEVLLIELPE